MTIFFLTKNWDMWSDPNIGSLDSPGSLDSCTTSPRPARLLHIVSVGLQLLVPLFPRLPGLIEGKLERAPSPYTSFLLMKGSLSPPVVGGRQQDPHCRGPEAPGVFLLFPQLWFHLLGAGVLAAVIPLGRL